MTARCLALLVLAPLAACSAPSDSPPESVTTETAVGAAPEASGDVVEEARLTRAQGDALRALGVSVLLPRMGPDWTVTSVETETEYGTSYEVLWRRADGACAVLLGTNDGLGGPEYPITSATVTIPGLPGAPEAQVYQAADDPEATSAQNWGASTVLSDYIETGGMWHWLISNDEGGCAPLALNEAASIVAGLRPLQLIAQAESDGVYDGQEPVWDDPELGTFVFDDSVTGDAMQGDPLEAVRAWMSSPELDDADIEVLSSSPEEIRILATRTNLPDDSVRDERSLFVFRSIDGEMGFYASGLQFRCWPTRGHQTWSAEACL